MIRRALLLSLLAASPLGAQTATLVRDVNPAAYVPVEAAKAPQQFTPLSAGAVFFTPGDEADPIVRLWATDGTAAGTRFLAAFCEDILCPQPQVRATLPGLAFFVAESDRSPGGYRRPRLWRTDGTPAGTFPITPTLNPFAYGDEFLADGNRLLFNTCVEDDSGQTCSLWKTDGTLAGTSSFSPVYGGGFIKAGGQIYFAGTGVLGEGSRGLWRTDGTASGTERVRSFPSDYYLWNFVAAGSRLFFQSGPYSGEVWTSNGTATGTSRVRTFFEYQHEFLPLITVIHKTVGDGKVVLTGMRDGSAPNLWLTDGTRAGTVRLTDAPRTEGRWTPWGDQIAILGKRLVFVAGSRLWSSDGSLATTRAFGPEVIRDSSLVQIGNRVLFAAKDAAHGAELWISDGTRPGTRLLSDLCPGPCGSEPEAFTLTGRLVWFRTTIDGASRLVRTDGTAAGTVVLRRLAGDTGLQVDLAVSGGKAFFAGFDPRYGAQPWVTDGTRAGTRRVTALPGQGGSSDPKDFTTLGDRLLFTADDGTGTSFWLADGAGASPVPGTAGIPGLMNVTMAGGHAFFTAGTSDLWRTNGTAPGTLRLAAFPDQTLSELHGFGGRLVFFTSPSPALWESDGTVAGTVKIVDLPPGANKVSDVAALGSELYFAAGDGIRAQVFRSDGTVAGTRPILDLPCPCTAPDTPLSYARVGDLVYLVAWSSVTGPSLWRTDGTAGGTIRVVPDPARGGGPWKIYFPESLFSFGGDLYFFAHTFPVDEGSRTVLFRGRDENAVLLAPAGGFPFEPSAPDFTPVGNALFFRAWDPEHGTELWKTDGTPQGTVLVWDILPGPSSSDPRDLTAAGGRLYFSARDAAHGRELWVTDGTAAGTRLVQDLFPGGSSSSPEQLLVTGGRLYFTADDGVVGREPWSLVVPVPAP